jgi:protein SCO1
VELAPQRQTLQRAGTDRASPLARAGPHGLAIDAPRGRLCETPRMSVQAPRPTAPDSPDGQPPAPPERRWGFSRLLLPGLVILVVLGGVTLLLVGGSSKQQLPGGATSAHVASFEGATLSPIGAAPPLSTLRDSLGEPVNLSNYRGKAVFITFLYTHCPDVCPLIASSLHSALAEMGPKASQVQLIAVSVDPRGDTPATVATFLHEHELTGKMKYLIGSAGELAPVWNAWHVGSARDVGNPQLVNHSALIYGVSASGKLVTIYPSNFTPSQIIHDVPGLLAS